MNLYEKLEVERRALDSHEKKDAFINKLIRMLKRSRRAKAKLKERLDGVRSEV